jgi:DNA polymerase (family 10)
MLDRNSLKKIFSNIAILLEIKGELPFKTKAYQNAAELLSNNEIDFDLHLENKSLKSIPGIGDAISKKIIEFAETGKMEFYENLILEYPADLVKITKLAKIGIKKTAQIFKELGISNIDILEKACEENQIASLKGFGEKTQENILTSISHTKASKGRFLQNRIVEDTFKLIDKLNNLEIFNKIEVSGEQKRFSEIIESVDLIAEIKNIESFDLNILNEFLPELIQNTEKILKIKLNCFSEYPCYLYVASKSAFYLLNHELSSSNEYLRAFKEYSKEQNIKFNADSIVIDDNKYLINSEEDIYKLIDLSFVPAELRENNFAIEKAKNNNIPKLIENEDMKGILHMHTIWSDGNNTVREMALKAKELGFEYVGISDHSKSSVYTNGLNEERIIQQHQEIDLLNNENLGIHIYKGIESDILLDGSLDYSNDVLETFDFVIASVHSSFTMPKKEMTKRICTALKNPYTMMLGHPTGRLLLSRAGYELDIDEIIDTAAKFGKIIELNSNPYRLDLSWQNIIRAKEKGVMISINPDSHKKSTLSDIYIGAGIARKGWIETKDVLNTFNLKDFNQYIIDFKNKRKNKI